MSQECSLRKTFTSSLRGGQVDERCVQLENYAIYRVAPLFKIKAPGFTILCVQKQYITKNVLKLGLTHQHAFITLSEKGDRDYFYFSI